MKNIFLLLLLVLASCNANKAKIEGRIADAEKSVLLLEKVQLGKNVKVDSVRLPASGKFSFAVDFRHFADGFFQLRLDSAPPVLLLLAPKEKVRVEAQAQQWLSSMTVEGSEESEHLLLLQKRLLETNQKMDSLLQSDLPQKELQHALGKVFVAQKQYNIVYIMSHLGSLTTAVAYYQKAAKTLPLFGDAGDRFLLSSLLDSLRKTAPKSPYVLALESELENLQAAASRQLLAERMQHAPMLSKPEIALPDVQGNTQSLNALANRVVLLHFWASGQPSQRLDNRELLNLHKEFAGRGLQIYQVSLDTDKGAWTNAVREQQLNWINVCSLQGLACPAAQSYNVTALPSNFLIDKKGDVVAKNVFGEALKKQIARLLN